MRFVYPAFTAAMLVASLLCLWHAWGDRNRLALYLTSLAYGLVLEKLVIIGFQAYSYPASEYLFQLFGIPLAIALGWSAVLYSGIASADALGVPRIARPGFVGLYALHVDLSMDAIAIRVPYWEWTPPGIWFGVPIGNFFGWFAVAVLFTAWFDVFRTRIESRLARSAGTFVAAVGSLLVVLHVWVTYVPQTRAKAVVLVGCVLLSISILTIYRPTFAVAPSTGLLAAILVFHVFFLTLLLVEGYYRETPVLLPLSLGMGLLGLGIHRLPVLGRSSE